MKNASKGRLGRGVAVVSAVLAMILLIEWLRTWRAFDSLGWDETAHTGVVAYDVTSWCLSFGPRGTVTLTWTHQALVGGVPPVDGSSWSYSLGQPDNSRQTSGLILGIPVGSFGFGRGATALGGGTVSSIGVCVPFWFMILIFAGFPAVMFWRKGRTRQSS